MSKGKAKEFNFDEFDIKKKHTETKAQEAQHVQEVHEIQEALKENKKLEPNIEFGSTQGKKGYKAKRINMAFSDINHEFIKIESRKNGLSMTEFVNMIIDNYRNN